MRLEERLARQRAKHLAEALRARADELSLDAAAEIEGTLEAFAGLVAAQRRLRERLAASERNMRSTLDLWLRIPERDRMRAVHNPRNQT